MKWWWGEWGRGGGLCSLRGRGGEGEGEQTLFSERTAWVLVGKVPSSRRGSQRLEIHPGTAVTALQGIMMMMAAYGYGQCEARSFTEWMQHAVHDAPSRFSDSRWSGFILMAGVDVTPVVSSVMRRSTSTGSQRRRASRCGSLRLKARLSTMVLPAVNEELVMIKAIMASMKLLAVQLRLERRRANVTVAVPEAKWLWHSLSLCNRVLSGAATRTASGSSGFKLWRQYFESKRFEVHNFRWIRSRWTLNECNADYWAANSTFNKLYYQNRDGEYVVEDWLQVTERIGLSNPPEWLPQLHTALAERSTFGVQRTTTSSTSCWWVMIRTTSAAALTAIWYRYD